MPQKPGKHVRIVPLDRNPEGTYVDSIANRYGPSISRRRDHVYFGLILQDEYALTVATQLQINLTGVYTLEQAKVYSNRIGDLAGKLAHG